MRRLALLAAAVLAVAAAPAVRAEPLDVDLSRLGAPDPNVWTSIAQVSGKSLSAADAAQLAKDSRTRFAILSTELALALSSAVLQPASTTGHSGFAVDLEVASMTVHSDPVGVSTAGASLGFTNQVWPTQSTQPSQLYMPSVHVRKAFPWSIEMGGRLIYLSSSNAYAAQAEGKWAICEGFDNLPDFAVRGAYTHLFGVPEWSLSSTDVDLMLSKRFAMMGVTSLTPYAAARFTWVSASSERLDFAPARGGASPTPPTGTPSSPWDTASTQAAFPTFKIGVYRTTVGVKFTAYSVALGLEGTYFGGASSSSSGYEGVKIKSALGGAAKLGWEW
jgi:hypothetical protein